MNREKNQMVVDMKFLADVNVEKQIIDYLKKSGYNILWVPDLDCRMIDEKILEVANKEKRILITNDKDFGDIIFRQKHISTGIILIHIKDQNTQHKLRLLQKLLLAYGIYGNFVVLTEKKVRIISTE